VNILKILLRALIDSFRPAEPPPGVSDELWAKREQMMWAMRERQESGMYKLWE
jgi:hypothetical protein